MPHHLLAHMLTHLFCPIGVLCDRLNRASGNDSQVTEVKKVSFSGYNLDSANKLIVLYMLGSIVNV